MTVAGSAAGPSAEFLDFVEQSPVAEWIGHASSKLRASGAGRLALRFQMPLDGGAVTGVAGEYRLIANQLRLSGAPALSQVDGTVEFTDRELSGRGISAHALGGPVTLSLRFGEGQVHVDAEGSAAIGALREAVDFPLAQRISGATDWRLAVDGPLDAMGWVLESSLAGAAIDLPAPLGKAAAQAMPLRVVRRDLGHGREDAVSIEYGGIARVLLHRQLTAEGAGVDRAQVLLGKSMDRPAPPPRRGLWIRADLPRLNVDDWLAFRRSLDARPGAAPAAPASLTPAALTFDGIDLRAGELQAMGRRFNELSVSGRRTGDDWRLSLDGREIAGNAIWQAATPSQPNGSVVARLSRFAPPDAGELVPWAGTPDTAASTAGGANPWPAIDISANAFMTRGRDVGRLEVVAEPAAADWQIRKLSVVNPAGRIDAHGVWHGGRQPQTRLDVKVVVQATREFLARFAMPDAIRGAPTTIEGQLAWAGAPSDFDYPSLSGSFHLHSGAGQFIKADPGVGRLLGVLSLQALPRRISLDFRDVFSEGFAFDNADGTVHIRDGVMHTDQFRLVGPAAAVEIDGDVDLARETQQLKVRVQPSLTSGVSAGAAALFIANPLVGAAVGAGTLLAQKILNNPIEQLFSYEYGVSGGWADPVVQRLNAKTAASWPQAPEK
jgi:uncharacterized protein (TIGR02099 family)